MVRIKAAEGEVSQVVIHSNEEQTKHITKMIVNATIILRLIGSHLPPVFAH